MFKNYYVEEKDFNDSMIISTFSALVHKAFGYDAFYVQFRDEFIPRDATEVQYGVLRVNFNTYEEYQTCYRNLAFHDNAFVLPEGIYIELYKNLADIKSSIEDDCEFIWVEPTSNYDKIYRGNSFHIVDTDMYFKLVQKNNMYQMRKILIEGDMSKENKASLTKIFLQKTQDEGQFRTARKMYNLLIALRNELYNPKYKNNPFAEKLKNEISYLRNRFNGLDFYVYCEFVDGSKYGVWVKNSNEFEDKIKIDDIRKISTVEVRIVNSAHMVPGSTVEFYDMEEDTYDIDLLFKKYCDYGYKEIKELIQMMMRNGRRAVIKEIL